MRISKLIIENYRTIENLELEFHGYYGAISGKNNSGKTNIVKAIRSFFNEFGSPPFIEEMANITKNDFPNWITQDGDHKIRFKLELHIHKDFDAGLYRFVTTFLSLKDAPEEMKLSLEQIWNKTGKSIDLLLGCEDQKVEDSYKKEEIFKRIRSSQYLLFHNSTQQDHRYIYGRQFSQLLTGFPNEDAEKVKKANDNIIKILQKSAQRHQKDIIELLGRLEEKYSVTLSVPRFEFDDIPYTISLGDKSSEVPLDEWGSGTQNRTMILLHLLRAKRNREISSESNKTTPILLIEEPESFLHPSAQAEFGKMLQDLAEEFSIQVITTTHSPYMLSLMNPAANVLLCRDTIKGKLSPTKKTETSGDNWMEPFGLALGIDNESFSNWRHVLFKKSNQLLLVEGKTDVEYFTLLKSDSHGINRLNFDGEIFPYGGTGFFDNTVLVKFVLSRFSKLIITYDLDKDEPISKKLQNIGLKKGRDFFAIGVNQPGRRDIEGLVSERIRSQVYASNTGLVATASSSDKEKSSAKNELKAKMLEVFKRDALAPDDYSEFYKIVKLINKSVR